MSHILYTTPREYNQIIFPIAAIKCNQRPFKRRPSSCKNAYECCWNVAWKYFAVPENKFAQSDQFLVALFNVPVTPCHDFDTDEMYLYLKEKLLARCIDDLEEHELVHLSQKLNALECVKLVQAAYELIPTRVKHKAKRLGLLSEETPMSASPEECFLNLEQWSNDYPSKSWRGKLFQKLFSERIILTKLKLFSSVSILRVR